MMTSIEPGEALGLAAQVAVTLAGFAGVVVVFRPHSVHQWSKVDRFRLRLLLNNSILPLAYAVIGIFLLAMRPPPASIWRWCSAVATLCQLPFAIFNFTTVRKFSAVEFKGVNKVLFFPLFAIGIAMILLQLYNIVVWNWFWPFFAGIVVHLIAAMLQFMRLVLLPRPNEAPREGV
jgi:hypothetical protein